jgi:hypothetical protein
MRKRLVPFAVVLAALLGGAPGALAATVRADGYDKCPGGEEPCILTVEYDAAQGEVNTVTVSGVSADGGYLLSDATAPLTAGENCTQMGPGSVRCALAGGNPFTFVAVYLRLGDMDDELTAIGQTVAFGGPGADTLTGGAERDALVGGPGPDILHGGANADSLQGDEGATVVANDVLDGGPGTDEVTYRDRELPVTADLRSGSAGSPGEQDRLEGIETVEGGLRDNTLTGDDGPNGLRAPFTADPVRGRVTLDGGGGNDSLYGGPGSDRIQGGAGDDTVDGGVSRRPDDLRGGEGNDSISGSQGADRISGGPGDDAITPRLEYALQKRGAPGDRIACGSGHDAVAFPYRRALVPLGCETVRLTNALLIHPRRAARRRVVLNATLRKARSSLPACRVFAELRGGRSSVLLGRSERVRWRRNVGVQFDLRLTEAGVRRLEHGGSPIRVRIVHVFGCRRETGRRVEGFSVRSIA